MSDRYAALKAAALKALSLDESTDRGDVANPATGMPRDMASRCALCGKDMSVRDVEASDDQCSDCEMADEQLSSPAPHTVIRPGGSTTTPREPMTKDSNGGSAALGGPGSGPHGGGGKIKRLVAVVKDAAKEIGHGIVNQYHIPKVDSKGDRPEDRGTRGPINDIAKHRDPWD